MDEAEQYDGILDDDALAPLKRNHACLQCKKRKVKCDALKPTCSPCMRSHAHAVRAAQRNGTPPPQIACTYTDGDHDDESSNEGQPAIVRKESGEKKKNGIKRSAPGFKASAIGAGPPKAKEKKLEDEREMLKIKIADLERKLAQVTPSTTASSISADNIRPSGQSGSFDNYRLPEMESNDINAYLQSSQPVQSTSTAIPFSSARVEEVPDQAWPESNTAYGGATANVVGNMDLDWDLGGLFMVPANWPMNLPSPFLLEHLIETFFNCVPQIPRMIHRGNLGYRVRLPPTHKDFPHASLLHAICAIAASHTAWVNSIPPEKMEETATRAIASGQNMEDVEDFGLAQAFAARRAMDQSATCCAMGSGHLMFGLVQAAIILAEVFFQKGMPLQGWLMAGVAPRLIKSLELGNRNHNFKRPKEPMLPPPTTAVEREERIATVWMAHIQDSGFAINSYWSQSMDWRELKCPLPTSASEFRKQDAEIMAENSQTAFSPNVLIDHPVADTFVLVVKASLLMSRTARWLQDWNQREITDNDELEGQNWPSFIELIQDIHAYQQSIPAATRNVFRILDQPSSGFDSNLLLVHILPNISLCLINEPFIDWSNPGTSPLHSVQKAYEGIVGMLHLIPSNLDVSLVMTPLLAFSLYTTGRIVANFMQKALDVHSYGLAVRYRADLTTIQGLLGRHGLKHTLGGAMSTYLSTYLTNGGAKGAHFDQNKNKANRICLDPEQAESYPILPPKPQAPQASSAPYTAFPTNTAQFQDNVHMDYGPTSASTFAAFAEQTQAQAFHQEQNQGTIDMSTYLTQMNMNSTTFSQAQGFGGYDYDYAKQSRPQSQQYGNGGGLGEAYISPESYTYTNTNPSYASSSSRNFSGSSKTTPESASLVDPSPNSMSNTNVSGVGGGGVNTYFDGSGSLSSSSGSNTKGMAYGAGGMGDIVQGTGEERLAAHLSEYMNRDGKGY